MGSSKKRRKDNFLRLISKQISFCHHSKDNIIYANNGCNEIIINIIILFRKFKFVRQRRKYFDECRFVIVRLRMCYIKFYDVQPIGIVFPMYFNVIDSGDYKWSLAEGQHQSFFPDYSVSLIRGFPDVRCANYSNLYHTHNGGKIWMRA